jgi:aspartyl protease family protein
MSAPASPRTTARTGAFAITLVWLVVAAALYVGFKWLEARDRQHLQPYEGSAGELVIPRYPDGHFYVAGEVNRVPVLFLVDTGASAVSVSETLARQAQLPSGRSVTLRTANGERPGELVHGIPVRAGHLALNDTTVISGLVGMGPQQALLGQSFLKHFDIELRQREMVLRPRLN